MRGFYNFISYLFFPGSMAVVGFWTVSKLEGIEFTVNYLVLPFIMFLAAPVLVLYIFLKNGLVSDIHVYKRQERSLSYIVAIAFALLFVVFTQVESWLYRHWALSVMLTLISLMTVNLFWMKASAHMAGIGGFVVLTLFAYSHGNPILWFVCAAILSGIIYLARKGLSAHSHIELITGFSLGFLVTFVTFRI